MWWLTRVRGHSMAPTLTDGQLVLTRSLRPAHAVGRGDLVVLDSPVEPHEHVVKRVVGLPGEQVTFDAGRVSIDGRPLPEPYASPSVFRGRYDVPPGHFLVLGDNRDASSDSRSWDSPYTPRSALRGILTGRSVRRTMRREEPHRGRLRGRK
jgi:signal peptidase I